MSSYYDDFFDRNSTRIFYIVPMDRLVLKVRSSTFINTSYRYRNVSAKVCKTLGNRVYSKKPKFQEL